MIREIQQAAQQKSPIVWMGMTARVGGVEVLPMPTPLRAAITQYLRANIRASTTIKEYQTTLKKWSAWGNGVPIEQLGRREVREFLDWVHERAIADEGTNPGRTANKARDHLRAIIAWAWEQDLIDSFPRFPKPKAQRLVAGRHYLTKAEINALYFATHDMKKPKGWKSEFSVGRYWRAAIVLFFNYGLDTGTVWKTTAYHQPILWRNIFWDRQCPDRQSKQLSRWGWVFYRRIKTNKSFYRPMNRAVHAHVKSLLPRRPNPDSPVFLGGSIRPNLRFQSLWQSAGIAPKKNSDTGADEPWELKDLRKTCATYHDEHIPESSIEILGHSVGGVTYRHYAHRAPLAFRAISTLPQPMAFSALLKGNDENCPCCKRRFNDAS